MLTFPLWKMTPEQIQKLRQVEDLLLDIGVRFDTGVGCGGRDWFLDSSMTGATIIAHSEGE
ncbi:MAG: hypothetical protein AB1760_00270 [Pseudomonadota bacterium]